jgi:hypothetical protein
MLRDFLAPRSPVLVAGIYRVHHYQHRLPHLVTVSLSHFPECKTCHDRVRFEPVDIPTHERSYPLLSDQDFLDAASSTSSRNDLAESASQD